MRRVVRVIARLNTGGPARHVALLCDGMRSEGFESLLVFGALAPGEGSLEWLAENAGFRTERIAELGRSFRPLDDWRAFRRVLAILRRERPHVVHTHTSKGGTLGRLAALVYNATVNRDERCIVVHTFHGHVFKGYFGRWTTAAVKMVERLLALGTDAVVAVSGTVADELVADHRIVARSRVHVIPLGLVLDDLTMLERDAARRRAFGFAAEDVVFGFVGRLVPIKALDVLLDAFAVAHEAVRHVRLLIVGDGELRPALERQAHALGLAEVVRFEGWRHDLPAVYGAIDALVLSSLNEGTPVAVIEAAAAGVPSVATNVGGVADLVTSGRHGLLVYPGDRRALADALIRMARSPEDRRRMGKAARCEIPPHHAPERLLTETAALYDTLLARRHRGNTVTPVSARC